LADPPRLYHAPSHPFFVEAWRDVLSAGPPEGPIIMLRRRGYLFQPDQVRTILDLIGRGQALARLLSRAPPRCRLAAESVRTIAHLIRLLAGEGMAGLKGMRCITCGICRAAPSEGGQFRNTGRMLHALSPQVLPPILPLSSSSSSSGLGDPLYPVDPYVIHLARIGRTGHVFYVPVQSLSLDQRLSVFDAVARLRQYERKDLKAPVSLDLRDVIEERRSLIRRLGGVEGRLMPYVLYYSVGLQGVYPALADELVSELFADREGSFAYLDHREFGRCRSSILMTRRQVEHLLTFARIASGKAIDYASPSLRASIRTNEFHIRVSADAPPLSVEGTALAVRKFFSKPIDLAALIGNGTITPDAAAYCVASIRRRRSVTIYGESGSGKTTLAIALDLRVPRTWRKISVESDVTENVSQLDRGRNQVRLLASSSSKTDQEKRTRVLNSLLHKSPDYVFFGEVLSREDSMALFQILGAGLKCMHTIHSESGEALLRRWVFQHRIPAPSLRDLDLLVHVEKARGGTLARRVTRISEVEKDKWSDLIPLLRDVFVWDRGEGVLRPTIPASAISLALPCYDGILAELRRLKVRQPPGRVPREGVSSV